MRRVTEIVHDRLRRVVRHGDVALDATAGNGHDTAVLSDLVGPTGHVYAFDVQDDAIRETGRRLRSQNRTNVTLVRADHATMAATVPPGVAAVTFNLGYRPGGDHGVVTRPESTSLALAAACGLLRAGGIVTVVAYVGHPGGRAECEAVAGFVRSLPRAPFTVEVPDDTPDSAPRLFMIHKERT